MGSIAKPKKSVLVRPAWPDEGPALSELAMNAKARWGYDDDFMESCRDELTITRERIGRERIRVAETGGVLAGFAAMKVDEERTSVEDLFVSPSFIGTGIGQILVDDFLQYARRHGIRLVHVEADPNAAPFYEHVGFRLCGEVASGSIPGRRLPLMEVRF
ncbi:MAG TPA: GNAT family N-acetyltransferase [Parvibaculum sp.]